jgi:transcriptional regulator with XRE-family HTH domain
MSEAPKGSQVAARHHAITQRLRDRRDELGLTQKQIVTRLAKCGLRTTNRALSSLEHGSGLDVAKLPELAIALDCTVTYLIGLTDDPHRWEPDVLSALPSPRRATSVPAVRPPDAERRVPAATGAPQNAPPRAESLILGAFLPERGLPRRDPGPPRREPR